MILTACSQKAIEYVYVEPACNTPVEPSYQFVDLYGIYSKVEWDTYKDLVKNVRERKAYIRELQAMLNEICN